MAGEPWTDEGTKEFKAFQNLERLHLECTKVTGVTLVEIATLPKLTYLNLCNTAVGDPAVGQLERLKSLRKLYVYGNHLTREGISRLAKALPACEIGPTNPHPTRPNP